MKKTILILLLVCIGSFTAADEVLPWIRLTVQGEDMMRTGRFYEALSFFQKAEQQQQQSTRLYMNIAICYKLLAEREKVTAARKELDQQFLAVLRKVLELDPIHPDARYLMDSRLGIVSEVLPFKNQDTADYDKAARAAMQNGAIDAAIDLYTNALKVEAHPDIYKGLGIAALQKGDIGSCRENLHKALEINPIQHDAYMVLGQLCEQEERWADARDYYIKSLASYPHYFTAMDNVSVVISKLDQPVRFLNLVDPIPADKRLIKPDDYKALRELTETLKRNAFELQCWLTYHNTIAEFKANHEKEIPGIAFKLKPEIEAAALAAAGTFYAANHEHAGVELQQFDIIHTLHTKGLLKAAVFFYRWRDEYSKEFVQYRREHFDEMVEMLQVNLVP